jgi:signal transduction histidine kinase
MLDYLTAGIAFWMTLFGVQEWLLELRLGYLGRYWFVAIGASLLLSFLLSAPITITLIIKFGVDPFTWTDNIILCAIAAVIFGVMLTFSQWLILRQSEMTPRVFALINTVVGIGVYFLLVWLNEGTLEWSGSPFGNWKTVAIFLAGGAITGAATGKALDFYCWRVERRLIQLEREREGKERLERERIEREIVERRKLEKEKAEREALEKKMIEREIALESERKWYEEHGDDDFDYDEDEDEE